MTLEIPTAGWVALSLLATCVLVLAFVAFVWLTALARLAGELMGLLRRQSEMICAMKNTQAFSEYSQANPSPHEPRRADPEEPTAYGG